RQSRGQAAAGRPRPEGAATEVDTEIARAVASLRHAGSERRTGDLQDSLTGGPDPRGWAWVPVLTKRGETQMPNPHSTARVGGHPLHPMLVPIPIPCFLLTPVSDLAY